MPTKKKVLKYGHTKKSGSAPAPKAGFGAKTSFANPTKASTPAKGPATAKKIPIKTTSTAPGGKMAAGSHKLSANQKHQGIVKPKMKKKLESIEKFIKRRNYGEGNA